ncbi:hypothetical protein AX768_25790 [Burkholderia sp. PAMC 28687]|nr:hypothetical protein AX768_25790 [Burkholderia sp. PAMC 28687]
MLLAGGFIVRWRCLVFIFLQMRLLPWLWSMNGFRSNLLAVMLFLLLYFLVVCNVTWISHGNL